MQQERAAVKNAADQEQVKKAGEKARFGRDRELNDIRYVLSTVQGRRFVWRYLGLCGVFQSSFTGNSETFFREGERNVGLKLLTDINEASPDAYTLMLREAKNEERK